MSNVYGGRGRNTRAGGARQARRGWLRRLPPVLVFLALLAPGAAAEPAARPGPNDVNADYLLHLPGIGGYRWVDRTMVAGLRQGGYDGRLAVHDWTGEQAGLEALLNRPLHERESTRVAEALEKRYRENPNRRIILTAHSGGTGIAAWALEKLPPDVRVDAVIFLASALSPGYDLSEALRRVRGKVYSFYSATDTLILGAGTRTFGTIDGVKCDAGGRCGFVRPAGADEAQYEKLVQVPYDAAWMNLGNIGDHIGPMAGPFARDVLAPVVRGDAPKLTTSPTPRAAEGPNSGASAAGPSPADGSAAAEEPAVGDQTGEPQRRVRQRRAADAPRQ